MPLTPFQKEVLRTLAANRSPESHIAGGAVINRQETGLRYSDDLDNFHDVAASVAASAEALHTGPSSSNAAWVMKTP